MNILVTGGNGFIGRKIVQKLCNEGHNVRIFDTIAHREMGVKTIIGDICSLDELCLAAQGMEVIYHLAAVSNIHNAAEDSLHAVQVNIMGTANVLEAAKRNNVSRVIFASSYYVFSSGGHIYRTTKLTGEMLCKDYQTLFGVPYTILRYATVYGPDSREEDVISIFIKNILHNKPITIEGDGNQARNFVYIDDLVDGNVAALNKNAINKVLFIGGPDIISINELLFEMEHIFQKQLEVRYCKTRDDDFSWQMDQVDNKYDEAIWYPKIGLSEGITNSISYFTKKYGNSNLLH